MKSETTNLKGIFDKTWWVKAVSPDGTNSVGFTIKAGDVSEALSKGKSSMPSGYKLAEVNEVIH